MGSRQSIGVCGAVLGAGLWLCACKPDARPAGPNDLPCFPPQARRWIALEDPATAAAAVVPTGPVVAYIDHSGSMAGFARAARGNARPFQDLIATLPEAAGVADSGAFRRRLFGKTLQVLPAERADELLKTETYSCPRHGPDCDNQESRLDVALAAIADSPHDELSLVLTDMWLDNTEVMTSGAVALSRPLDKIILSGRSVAVYGVPAAYTGRIYDLPSGRAFSIKGRRPLILLAIGPVARLNAFDARLARSPSSFIAKGLASGAIRHSLFTQTPEVRPAVGADPFAAAPGNPAIRPGVALRARRGLHIQSFVVRRSGLNALAAASPSPPSPRWVGPSDSAMLAGAVWKGPATARATAWRLRRDAASCSADDWMAWGRADRTWSTPGPGLAAYGLKPQELVVGMQGRGVYLITGEVVRTALAADNPGDDWMRAWSFSADEEKRVLAAPPPVFPTLNLGETARLLENVLDETAKQSPSVVSGFTVAVKIDD